MDNLKRMYKVNTAVNIGIQLLLRVVTITYMENV
jgi:hypothetical protein